MIYLAVDARKATLDVIPPAYQHYRRNEIRRSINNTSFNILPAVGKLTKGALGGKTENSSLNALVDY